MKGCFKGCAAIALMMIFLSVVAGYFLWQAKPKIIQAVRTVFDMPEHGKREYIDQHYGEFINAFIEIEANVDSVEEIVESVETMDVSDQILFFKINAEGKEWTPVNQSGWSGVSSTVINGYGAGHLTIDGESQPISIYKQDRGWSHIEEVIIYFVHPPSVSTDQKFVE
jgi:hypothetical protein